MIGVIADDLTGAAELAAVGLRHGLRAEVVVKGRPSGRSDVVCLDTDSRSCAPEEAGRRAASAADRLRRFGARWVYKKVDSVLRGPVTAELEAVMKALGLKRALLVPANPSLGRVIKEGRYLVGGKPIHKTEFARDPEHPRSSSDVLELLAAPQHIPIRVCGVRDPFPADGIVVGEATTPDDLQRWAVRRSSRMLAAGGAEFFAAVLAADGHKALPAGGDVTATASTRTRKLFVCGTASKSAREFVSSARARGIPVFSLPRALARGGEFTAAAAEGICQQVMASFRSQSCVILNVGLPAVRDRSVAKQLAMYLVQVAESVLRQARVGQVYAEGGATAVALVRRMGWTHLAAVRELAPGVAMLAVDNKPPLLLTIKPGSYVWPR